MARRRSPDDIDGVLVVDKPAAMTSHDAVRELRRVIGQHRIGHTGTLDPAATGVLVLCLGRATKLVPYLQAVPKTYAATMQLGITTDTQDQDGAVVSRADARHITERALCEALTSFQGAVQQIPPMVSAVKIGGERLHEKARRGETVEREPRTVTIHNLVLDEFIAGPVAHASFLVTCSSGTYVRTLAHDVGQLLGVGASLTRLRRLANGPFTDDHASNLDELKGIGRDGVIARLLAVVDAVEMVMPSRTVDDLTVVERLAHGGRLPSSLAAGHEGSYAVRTDKQLVGIYRQCRPELVWLRPDELVADTASNDTRPATSRRVGS